MRYIQNVTAFKEKQTVYTEFELVIPVGTLTDDWKRLVVDTRLWCEEQFGPECGAVWFEAGPFYFFIAGPTNASAFKLRWC